MLQFSCSFACYHVIVSQTAYRKKTWILTLHQANAPTLTRFIFFKHTPKLIIFGTYNLRACTHNRESGAGCKSVCTRLLSATSVSWDSVSSTAGQVCLRISSTMQSTSGKCDSECVWRPRDATLSIFCIKTGSFQSHPRFPEETCIIFGMQFERR